MPYCGRYGCACCTCQECGGYNTCICEKKRRAAELAEKLRKRDELDEDDQAILDLLDDI